MTAEAVDFEEHRPRFYMYCGCLRLLKYIPNTKFLIEAQFALYSTNFIICHNYFDFVFLRVFCFRQIIYFELLFILKSNVRKFFPKRLCSEKEEPGI